MTGLENMTHKRSFSYAVIEQIKKDIEKMSLKTMEELIETLPSSIHFPTGMSASYLRTQGWDIPANVPDYAELWHKGLEVVVDKTPHTEEEKKSRVLKSVKLRSIEPEFRYVTIEGTIKL